jgi:hypothetical protein
MVTSTVGTVSDMLFRVEEPSLFSSIPHSRPVQPSQGVSLVRLIGYSPLEFHEQQHTTSLCLKWTLPQVYTQSAQKNPHPFLGLPWAPRLQEIGTWACVAAESMMRWVRWRSNLSHNCCMKQRVCLGIWKDSRMGNSPRLGLGR